ncbi:D-hexose-6-phosphate mutarotase [Haemophilus paracuniculus]|uniref:Putative glucose-6-phosphate 1-epimerase n=1 Tax=Haemophilus paracuniculus TaxID=734 RepID=A0A1T0AUG5_9PAST|nr:D-hexose-6-phosphate mutarotase [Haemophilus paracuniculus]OOS00310.1 D-hexose-6-phosphate mutarotase [Haemophilus paracuniculus]
MLKITHIKSLTPELNLFHYNDIPVLVIKHSVGEAKIALQGAQLLSWKPQKAKHDILWLSNIASFQRGTAIRGGIPLCYPWFGGIQQPAHGTARLDLWALNDYKVNENSVWLQFHYLNQQNQRQAQLEINFTQDCELTFTHYGEKLAQAVLHSYFRVGDIHQVEVTHLPQQGLNCVTQQQENYPSSRKIDQHIDCVYSIPPSHKQNRIVDDSLKRQIMLEQQGASNLVLWNPWHKAMSDMTPNDYQQMICLETGSIDRPLQNGESIVLRLALLAD